MTCRVFSHWLFFVLFSAIAATSLRAAEPSGEFLPLVLKLLENEDREFRAAALDQIRSKAGGPEATKVFAALLPKLEGSAQTSLLSALAERGDAAARPAVLDLLKSKEETTRIAAIGALSKLGESSDLPLLIALLSSQSAGEKSAARAALVQLRGDSIASALGNEMTSTASPVTKALLIDILAARRSGQAVPSILKAALDNEPQVRIAAMNALGQIGSPNQLADMLPAILKAPKGGERDSAEKNVVLVCSRINDADQRGAELIKAIDSIPESNRDELLSLIGRVGGKKLIGYVGDIATGKNEARRKIGLDALTKWPDATAADKLLEIAEKASNPAERQQAFQGYVKISATRDTRNDRQRLDRMKQAMKAAKTPEERLLVVQRCRTAYDVETVRFVLPFVDDSASAQMACETIVEIAHHRDVRDAHKAEFDKALDKVIATSKDAEVIERANRYKRGETWERPAKKS